jgi:hypothetical protein
VKLLFQSQSRRLWITLMECAISCIPRPGHGRLGHLGIMGGGVRTLASVLPLLVKLWF